MVAELESHYPGSTVEVMNLTETNVPHVDIAHLGSFYTPIEHHTPADKEAIAFSDAAIAQLFSADIIVVGAPLYNFGIPSTLKAWIDHLARAGKTFSYSSGKPEGLVTGKKVYVAMSSGGIYSEGPFQSYDFVAPYLQKTLGFMGMTDLSVIRVEGLKVPGVLEHAMDKAVDSFKKELELEFDASPVL